MRNKSQPKHATTPMVLSLLPSYRCNAACENCCFESNPFIKAKLSYEDLVKTIDEAADVGTFRLVVVSGGEPFLLGRELDALLSYITKKGMRSRVVTNGYWATDVDRAGRRLSRLKDLDEINFSTGDFHAEFVPWERVTYGAYAAVKQGLKSVVISVETREEANIDARLIEKHPLMAELLNGTYKTEIQIVESAWIRRGAAAHGQGTVMRSTTRGPHISHYSDSLLTRGNLHLRRGCQSILNTITVTPYGRVAACCGITREEIDELDLGAVGERPLSAMIDEAEVDLVKMWLSVEGPERMLAWAATIDPSIEWENKFSHQCDACRELFHNERVGDVVRNHYESRAADIMLAFTAMTRKTGGYDAGMSADTFAEGGADGRRIEQALDGHDRECDNRGSRLDRD